MAWCLELVIQGHGKFGIISRMSRSNVLSYGAFWPTRTPYGKHGLFLNIFEMTPNFTSRRAYAHGRHPCQSGMTSDTICKLLHVRSFIGLFWLIKLQIMQNLSKIQTTWHGAFNSSYKAIKIGVISKMSRNNVHLSAGAFWPTRTPSTEHGLFFEFFWHEKRPKLLQAHGHAHGRHPCRVQMISNTVYKLRHVRPFIDLFWQRKVQKLKI